MSHLDDHSPLFANIKQLIEDSKQQVAVAVNATMSMLYWRIGKQINEELFQKELEYIHYGHWEKGEHNTMLKNIFLNRIC